MATNKEVADLKRLMRLVAKEHSAEIAGELEDFGITSIKPPPEKVETYTTMGGRRKVRQGGEWDSFDRLHPKEKRRLKDFWMSESGSSLDELEGLTRPGSSVPFARDTTEASEKFFRMRAQIDALDVYAKTGKLPSTKGMYESGGNFLDLLQGALQSSDRFDQELLERGFDVGEFYSSANTKEAKGYLKGVREVLTDEELHYKEMYEAEIASQTPDVPQVEPSMTAAEKRQAAIDRGRSRGSKKTPQKPVIKNSPPPGFDDDYLTDDYLASLDEPMSGSPPVIDDDYWNSFGETFETKVTRHEPSSVVGESVEKVGQRLEPGAAEVAEQVVRKPMSPLEQRVKAAVVQAVDLAVDISNDVSKGGSGLKSLAGEIGAVGQTVKSSKTTTSIISSMTAAREVVSGLSRNKKIGYTLGGLAGIGAFTNRSRNERRR